MTENGLTKVASHTENDSYNKELVALAVQAKSRAYAPYSEFYVGAALEASSGKVYTGCNIENSSYPLSLCAERCAIAKAVSEGERHFRSIYIATDLEHEFAGPCGGCRQVLSEFGNFSVFLIKPDLSVRKHTVSELMPHAFTPKHLLMERHASPVHDPEFADIPSIVKHPPHSA
mmetsp:Transcript_17926/g.29440  ORF Transcript_17926/g.29440 Transcript_17926/m.29440 type:complete len:174 (+) Transcript_17926:37-558(+)|eukprot:CAMPEP_0184338570 /NCGR_PEP_ID=MMETSP1089-20130417/7142_1 /TAXON_ID=38269 ORGANISM="Gloeochaete wittrockiana, Strain SAG46.84" /NCGR_SAMPLE_ID=MMETSP1089 /ASSEMBLY_ACC=CAM_ASM_000445 /LENGTH=173 /DNA_ID=CAMNT_0026665181 /DNA_START=37 /DNA_END=558 /DNA_ORIENTATION=-